MATQEELVSLFAHKLHLQNSIPQEHPIESPYTYSISQHYHHSAHIPAQQRPASEPPQSEETAENILTNHGVDSSKLFPSQLDLFKTAEPAQQQRLIELWRICPPDNNVQTIAQDIDHWPQTSFEHEETLAKLRYERQIMEERMARAQEGHHVDSAESTMSDDTNAPLTPIQGSDGRWTGVTPEPYMASGYDMLAQKEYEQSAERSKDGYSHFGTANGGPNWRAMDPIYNTPGSGAVFRTPEEQQQVMENQYGAFKQHYGYVEDEEML